MDEYKQKFLNKNKESFDELNDYIITHRSDISRIIVSPDLFEFLKFSEFCKKNSEDNITYRDIRVVMDVYAPASLVKFLLKSTDKIKFNLPCICGIFNDEMHP